MIEDDAVTQNSHEHDTAPERMFTMIFLFEEPCPLPDRKLLKRLIKKHAAGRTEYLGYD
ncbi:hypothetical protein [Succinimonas sp.]|uniref:hypothetical protein n=1 Tax=Succinimonas sp. TaxID=1936151 RepID=UPI00386651E2